MTGSSEELTRSVKALARDCGYVACGITTAEPFVRHHHAIQAMIDRFPQAADLYRRSMKRYDPRGTAAWCNSVIACIRWYGKYRLPEQPIGHIGRNYLGDSRSEACPDHAMAKRMTEGLRMLGMRCKKGGVPDRWAAARAGVARFGRNTFVYAEEHGSWINVQTWRVNAELVPDEPTLDLPCPDNCRACMDACPTGAIEAPFCVHMDHCIAYLTYSAPFPVHPDLWAKMGEWVYGCDVCQQVCPLNHGKWQEKEDARWMAEVAHLLSPEALAEMDQQTYEEVVHPLFWYIPQGDLARWHANAKRAVAVKKGAGHQVRDAGCR